MKSNTKKWALLFNSIINIHNLRDMLYYTWKSWHVNSKFSINTTFVGVENVKHLYHILLSQEKKNASQIDF